MDTIFKQIADAAAAALAGLPEVGGRVFVDLDSAIPPEQQPALVITPGDDSSTSIDEETYEIRMELQLGIVTNTSEPLASVDVIERAVHERLHGDAQLASLLAGVITRTQGTRRVLRNTEGLPALRQLTYTCRSYVSACDMASPV
jgi:hypothetical protein